MKKVQLGISDVASTEVVFGTWVIGGWGGENSKNSLKAMCASFDNGVTSFDTAPFYGFGHSEELVGKFISEVGRDKVEIFTKFGLRWDTNQGEFYSDIENDPILKKAHVYAGKDGVIKEAEDCLRRLKTDYIDLFQIHRPDTSTEISETMEALMLLHQQGKIRAAGVSNYTAEQMQEAEKVIPIASNQVPYSMVLRKIENILIPHCVKNNNAILAYSPLQRGLLTGKITPNYPFKENDPRPTTRFFQEPNLSRTNDFLQKIKPIAETHNITLGQLVINWTLQQKGITAVLVGARNDTQAIENAKAVNAQLAKEEIDLINQHIAQLIIE